MTYRHNRGKHYVCFYNQNDELAWVDATWTDIGPQVPFNEISHRDSFFLAEDFLRLCGLRQALWGLYKKLACPSVTTRGVG